MTCKLFDNYIVFGMCILNKHYVIPEKAFAYYYHRCPLCRFNPKVKYIDDGIKQEIYSMRKSKMSYPQIGYYFGMSPSQIYNICRKMKEDGIN